MPDAEHANVTDCPNCGQTHTLLETTPLAIPRIIQGVVCTRAALCPVKHTPIYLSRDTTEEGPDDLNRLFRLFALLRDYTQAAGGDGDSVVISDNYLELANLFDSWEQRLPNPTFTDRFDGPGHVTFGGYSQESISFMPVYNGGWELNKGHEMVVRIYWQGY